MATTRPAPFPITMKAVRIHEYGEASELRLEESPRPAIQHDQILAKIHYAGVNPVDCKIRAGYLKNSLRASFPLTLGQDFSGEVAEAGKEATNFAAGARVFGFANGSYAEYAAAPVSMVAAIPEFMDYATAASLPTAGLTALQVIRDVVQARGGMKILIHGAAGGVGSFACQIAKDRGAQVIGTASGEDLAYLRSLGIAGMIDYKRDRFENEAKGVDAVVDLVGGETLARSYGVVKPGGVLVSTVAQMDEAEARRAGIRGLYIVMKRNAADLQELARLVERGAVRPRINQVLKLDQAKQAQELSESGRTHGKVLLKVA